jgi:glutathione S-transferase
MLCLKKRKREFSMKLYELIGRDPKNGFSPFAWRTKMVLAHKGLASETIGLRFTEIKESLSFAGSKTVPVLIDRDQIISDSWNIACYLEEQYPEKRESRLSAAPSKKRQ